MRALGSLVLFFHVSACLCSAAFASLGASESTVETDRQAVNGTSRTVQNRGQNQATYRVHEITSEGITIREFVNQDGNVFGVAWRGIGEPDLSQLFGSYFQEYKGAEPRASQTARRAPKKIKSSNVVVEKFGHMGDVMGKAYIPKLLPPGVTALDIQ